MMGVVFCPFFAGSLHAQVPQLINYQGRVAVSGTNFTGTGQFKFSLVKGGTSVATYWSNDGTGTAGGQPTNPVSLPVSKGLYSVLLGDSTLTNMTNIPSGVFSNSDVRLRVWFNDGANGWQQLTPDQRIAAVGYAMMANTAVSAQTVADGAITSAKIATGAIGSTQLAAGAVQASNIADGTISATKLSAGAAANNLNDSGLSGVASGGIVLSLDASNANLLNAGYLKLGQIDRVGGAWEQRSGVGSPSARQYQRAVWTGTAMIVWGGFNGGYLNDGGCYNPTANSWTSVATSGAPAARMNHTAVWTGSEMIVWGRSQRCWYFEHRRPLQSHQQQLE